MVQLANPGDTSSALSHFRPHTQSSMRSRNSTCTVALQPGFLRALDGFKVIVLT